MLAIYDDCNADAAGSSDSDGIDEAMNLNLYASDVRNEIWDIGAELFRDNGQKQPIAKFLSTDTRQPSRWSSW